MILLKENGADVARTDGRLLICSFCSISTTMVQHISPEIPTFAEDAERAVHLPWWRPVFSARPSSPWKNEVGLVIGATKTPSVGLQRGGAINLNSSLALGAECDRRLIGRHTAVCAGVDFLASPLDVKTSFAAADVLGRSRGGSF